MLQNILWHLSQILFTWKDNNFYFVTLSLNLSKRTCETVLCLWQDTTNIAAKHLYMRSSASCDKMPLRYFMDLFFSILWNMHATLIHSFLRNVSTQKMLLRHERDKKGSKIGDVLGLSLMLKNKTFWSILVITMRHACCTLNIPYQLCTPLIISNLIIHLLIL